MPDDTAENIILPTRQGYDVWSKIYDDEDNPLIGRDPRLPTLIQPQMNNRRLRELNYEVEGRRYFKLKRVKKRLRQYHRFSAIKKDARFLSSILVWGVKKGYAALVRKGNHRDAEHTEKTQKIKEYKL